MKNGLYLSNKFGKEVSYMKTVAQIFIIIGMVVFFWLIVPLVVGIFALKKLKTATNKKELQTMAIVTLLFCNLIGGIAMLMIPDEELAKNATTAQ